MKHNLKALGLAVVVALALSATLASAAQAIGRFAAGSYPAIVTGTSSGAFTNTGLTTTVCGSESFSTPMLTDSNTLQVTPSYSNCFHWGTQPVTITTNGCTFTLAISSLEGTTGEGQETVNCPAGKEIVMVRYETKAKQEKGESLCEWGIGPQGPLGRLEFYKQGSGSSESIKLETNIGFQAKAIKGSKAVCGGSGGTGISYAGTSQVIARADVGGVAGAQVGLSFGPGSIRMVGKESAEPSQQPRIEADWGAESRPVGGDQTAGSPHLLKFGGGVREISCSGVHLAGELSNGATELPLSAAYSGCTSAPGGLPATIGMNSCHYAAHVLNVGPPYAGSLDVACSTEGDGIEAKIYENKSKYEAGLPLCVYKISPQGGLGSIGFENVSTGVWSGVGMNLNLTGITYSILKGSKILCGLSGPNLTYTGGTRLYGV
jgi:hypothetical protein